MENFMKRIFKKKGAILLADEESAELKIIAYNGYAYLLKINFLKKDFEVIQKEKFALYKVHQNNESSINEKDSGIFDNYNPSFEENKKEEKKMEKFVVYE